MATDRGLALLTGARAGELLRGLLGPGEQLGGWRLRQVDHRPGAATTVAYDVTVTGSYGSARLLAGARVEQGDPVVWRFPNDPGLPALGRAGDEPAVRALLTSLGIPPGGVRLDVRSYRPGRRAVVEVRAPQCRLFLKVVRPTAVAALHERHRLLRDAGLPVPRSLGWTEDGLLVLEALTGTSLRRRLTGPGRLPDGGAVRALLDRLPRAVLALPLRHAWSDHAAHYANLTAAVLPQEGTRCRELAAEVQRRVRATGPLVPTHGDLYDTQLLVEDDRVTGLLDVDTVGPGRRADDLACVLGHLSLHELDDHAHRAHLLLQSWREDFERVTDPRDLRARVAGVLLSLATGPHRVQQADWPEATRQRLDLAERWLEPAARGLAPRR